MSTAPTILKPLRCATCLTTPMPIGPKPKCRTLIGPVADAMSATPEKSGIVEPFIIQAAPALARTGRDTMPACAGECAAVATAMALWILSETGATQGDVAAAGAEAAGRTAGGARPAALAAQRQLHDHRPPRPRQPDAQRRAARHLAQCLDASPSTTCASTSTTTPGATPDRRGCASQLLGGDSLGSRAGPTTGAGPMSRA